MNGPAWQAVVPKWFALLNCRRPWRRTIREEEILGVRAAEAAELLMFDLA
jgi:hypothetical protein